MKKLMLILVYNFKKQWYGHIYLFNSRGNHFALIGRYVASQKGRSESEGLITGGLLGILGVIIVVLLPSKDKKDV